ncbi:MAG: hypothetical protein CO064_09025 [Anaerolineae bacterium CG_4_9_14_0_8_um_filter_58_9]|nr:MAG: hypothetical protein CO064_09025 [Anaerolineae bacterium CG_4_9_14_0_8_um_filter_58_9]
MLKSGLILGVVALLLAIGAALLSPLCVPCLTLLLGLGAGYLAGAFDKPSEKRGSTKSGAIAGAIGGAGALIGQAVGAVINSQLVGPGGAIQLIRQLGIQLPSGATPADIATGYWGGVIGSTCCLGLFDVALMAGLGALGGLLWWQMSGSKRSVLPPSIE